MEAQFTVTKTLDAFHGWVKRYSRVRRLFMGPSGWDAYDESPTYVINCRAPVSGAGYVRFRVRVSNAEQLEVQAVSGAGYVRFRVRVSNAEQLEVQALTHWELEDKDPERRQREQGELDAYFAEFVQAIRAEQGKEEDRYVSFDEIAPRRVVENFVVRGTAQSFAGAVEIAVRRLWEVYADGRYAVRCLDPSCLNRVIVRQWPSMVDPERNHEQEIVALFVREGGELLVVRLEYLEPLGERVEMVKGVISSYLEELGAA